MKVYIYTQAPKESYYLGIKYLKETGKIDSYEIINIKAFRKLVKNVLISFGLLKYKQKDDIAIRELFLRAIAPVLLLFKKNIVLGIEPYDWIVIYGIVLKLLGKNLVYYTSWPYWLSGDQPKKEFLWSKFWWKVFLKDLKVVSINKKGAKELETFGAKIYHITHPVDFNKFTPTSKQTRNNMVKILTVARLEERKGIRDLIKLAETKALGSAEIIICGEGPLKDIVSRSSKKLKNLRYIPFNENTLPEVYRRAQIFVLNSYKVPGWEELFGMVLLEAMASGLPVVATDCVGPKEIIKDSSFGFLIPQRNLDQLKDRLRILIKDYNLRHQLGKMGRKEAEKNYSLAEVAKKWLEVLKA